MATTSLPPAPPGQFWKTPFVWEPGDTPPALTEPDALRFEVAAGGELRGAIAAVMSESLDQSDRHGVATLGAAAATDELLGLVEEVFEADPSWWQAARDPQGNWVGFVLPVLFRERSLWRGPRPQGTILYMGVLPAQRGRGHGRRLLDAATRQFIALGCWRVFCDTGTANRPMVEAFRRAGYREREPWLRPLA
jgi:ribosomal protein S18 acetylase RimI-like enzyme